ncbi:MULTISPECIES: GNAT family N-acetyltransferase [Streptomycetaceae]|uniref:Acetyltransferase n=1 Tax=Streptantibioticus cattleyicolor (strain ATCC 35852 / DSM 46488 / JCM 4925 / NBRC 14057 / NRRL 8057) TaxID=1003195 RepID=F8JTS8_STREN|nr:MULTISPECIES: GNAT family N-acetyltransferase [Streptomycetaceae]AEW96848.1 acetyltransferase [Streptantibioticus cattleyicolor NRRL 8057 = DSM 46488]MYS61328.1 GNAT family N-acetyltransferase [Streptomyces sp. SID5468]CCB77178.1 putative acetyltransferase, secreted [Streptantibioticus cattleyicolor NRRL 8057 = DSM 46488]
MDDVLVEKLDLADRVDDALAVQALAFGLTDDEIAIRRQIVLRHLTQPGVRALGATTPGGRLVGFGYGMPNDRAHWWSTVVEPYLHRDGLDHWLDASFVVVELHVLPAFQGRGVGRRLITGLTDPAGLPRSILSALDLDSPARHFYRSLGYTDLAHPVHFPGAPTPYTVMGAPLPLRRG